MPLQTQRNKGHFVFTSLSDLRAFSGENLSEGDPVFYSDSSNLSTGSTRYVWDASSIATDDGDLIIKLDDTTTGRLIRSEGVYNQGGTGAEDRTVIDRLQDFVSVKDFGAAGDGTTDDSAAIQAAIDANKGGVIKIPHGTYIHAGILLSGSTYDNTTIICEGTLKLKADGGSTNFGGAWVGIIVKDCDGVEIAYKGDGNRSNMTADENIYLIGVAGATNLKIPEFIGKEVRGDGIYISQSDWLSDTANPDGIHIGYFDLVNSADDGRNAISIIAGDNIHIDAMRSYQVGGVISTVRQPGGLDIEPNFGYQTISDVTVGSANIVTAGTGGCGIVGKAITDDATEDWCVSDVVIGNLNLKKTSGGTANNIKRCKNVTYQGNVHGVSGSEVGLLDVDYCSGLKMDVQLSNGTTCAYFGYTGYVRDFDIKVDITSYTSKGIEVTGVDNGTFRGSITGATSATATYAVQNRDRGRTVTQTNVRYEIDAPYDGLNLRAFQFTDGGGSMTYTDTFVQNCDLSGYASFVFQIDDANGIPSRNVHGRNEGEGVPTSGMWTQGDFVRRTNNSAVDANDMFIWAWLRITDTDGNGDAADNVDGTDWLTARVSNVSPAT